MKILETERTILREMDERDAEFVLELMNTPAFIKYIGDKGIKTLEQATGVIVDLYQKSYRENGYGLYAVELKSDADTAEWQIRNPKSQIPNRTVGFCGFVKREGLPATDIGFAFLPQFERKGFGFETAAAVMKYGREKLGLERILAITVQDNESSIRLLEKLGFKFEKLIKLPGDETELNLFSTEVS